MERTDSNERPARLQLAGKTTSTWRERAAAKEAEGRGVSPAPAAEEAPPARTGGYRPPALRDGGRAISRDNRDGGEVRPPPRDITPKPATPPINNTAEGSKGGKWVPPHLRQRA